jgi:hypothetical protein
MRQRLNHKNSEEWVENSFQLHVNKWKIGSEWLFPGCRERRLRLPLFNGCAFFYLEKKMWATLYVGSSAERQGGSRCCTWCWHCSQIPVVSWRREPMQHYINWYWSAATAIDQHLEILVFITLRIKNILNTILAGIELYRTCITKQVAINLRLMRMLLKFSKHN